MVFTANKCEVWDDSGELVVTGVDEDGLYRFYRPERVFWQTASNCGTGGLAT